MTTITIVRKNQHIAIAADSQTTFGDTCISAKDDAAWNKIFYSHGSYFAISGSAAHDLVLQSLLAQHPELEFSSRPKIFESFRVMHTKLKEEFFLKPEEDEEDAYESSQMTVLIANQYGIFSVFSLREVYEYHRFWAIGSGQSFALGAMHAVYMNEALTAQHIATLGVEAGCALDIHSSLPHSAYEVMLNK
jgi:ATP-dependent protease HslVU (ClpYQ) peptidase subunit